MDLADVKQKFDEVKRNHDIAFDAKDEQLQTAAALIRGKNVLGFLPTGYGKTLCIVIQTMINKKDSITLIVSPLSSLIDDQMATLGKWQLTCAKIESLADMSESTKIGTTFTRIKTFPILSPKMVGFSKCIFYTFVNIS